MYQYRIRIRNRLLQLFYKPRRNTNGLFSLSNQALSALDEIDRRINEEITPLLSDLF